MMRVTRLAKGLAVAVVAACLLLAPLKTRAVTDTGGGGSSTSTSASSSSSDSPQCGNVKISIDVNCDKTGENPIYLYLRAIIRFLAGLFGIAAVLMVIVAGVQYMASGGNPEAIKKAKARLFNVILSIILFAMMFGILSYIIPGGVL